MTSGRGASAELRARCDRRTVEELARAIGGDAARVAARRVVGVCPVDAPVEGAIAPVVSPRWLPFARAAASAGATLLVSEELRARPELDGVAAWLHPRAGVAMADLLDLCAPRREPPIVGEGCDIHPSVVLAPGVVVGSRVHIGPGSILGQPGFGWVATDRGLRHVPQLGGVVVEDDVWIGSLTTVDAGTLGPTRVRRGARIDSQVHVGHNADVGEHAVLCGKVGLAGSVKIGRGAVLGGAVGVGDHVRVGDGAKVAGGSGVIGDVPAGSEYAGYPAMPRTRWLRGVAAAYPKQGRNQR